MSGLRWCMVVVVGVNVGGCRCRERVAMGWKVRTRGSVEAGRWIGTRLRLRTRKEPPSKLQVVPSDSDFSPPFAFAFVFTLSILMGSRL